MVAFGKLPFQFQQRGDVLAEAVAKQDHKVLSQHLTKRDQDLEDYLATLKGARVSIASYNTAGPQVVNSGMGAFNVNVPFNGGLNGLEHLDTVGFVPLDPSVPYNFFIAVGNVAWSSTASSTAGICQINAGGTSDTAVIYDGGAGIVPWTFFQSSSLMNNLPANVPVPTWAVGVQMIEYNLGIAYTAAPGTLGNVTELSIDSISVELYIVD